MEIISIKESGMKYAIERASEVLLRGGVIAYPSDTIYGLGALYDNEDALRRIIQLKGRPIPKGLLLIVGNMDSLKKIVEDIPEEIIKLTERFWPGPLTVVLKAKPSLPEIITGGSEKVAVRIPGSSFALEFLRSTGLIITSTSANPSDLPPAEDVNEIRKYFPDIDLIIDGGKLKSLPSTIIELQNGKIKILREGVIPESVLLSYTRSL